MWRAIFFICLAYGIYANRGLVFTPKVAKIDLSMTDGGTLRLGPRMAKPIVLAFIVENCGYSDRAVTVLNTLRRSFKSEVMQIVGVYLNPADIKTLTEFKSQKTAEFPLAAGQPNLDIIRALHKSFEIGYPGRQIFVIAKTGKIYSIDAGDVKTADILKKTLKTIKKKTGLSANSTVSEPI